MDSRILKINDPLEKYQILRLACAKGTSVTTPSNDPLGQVQPDPLGRPVMAARGSGSQGAWVALVDRVQPMAPDPVGLGVVRLPSLWVWVPCARWVALRPAPRLP